MKYWALFSIFFFAVACSESEKSEEESGTEKENTEETFQKNEESNEIEYFANAQADLTIEGMSCEINCVSTVKKALRKVDGVTKVEIDFDAERKEDFCKVEFDNTMLNVQNLQSIIESVNDGAYKVTQSKEEQLQQETDESKETAFNFESNSSSDRGVSTSTTSVEVPSILDFVVALF